MNHRQRVAAASVLGVAAVLGLSACGGVYSGGSAEVGDVVDKPATVITMPEGAGNVTRVCDGTTGIYGSENSAGIAVTLDDPACR